MKKLFTFTLCIATMMLSSTEAQAGNFLDSYQATYAVSRGGKVMAEQATTFQTVAPNQYTLTDVTKGTRGLASFAGFERMETTHFQLAGDQIISLKHEMQQKIAFRTKTYDFTISAADNTIEGHDKQKFKLETAVQPISSHMLPLWLSNQICSSTKQHTQHISVPVLKSKRIKTYEFAVINEDSQLLRVERVYPEGIQRSSQVWLDKNQHCLPIKTRHTEADEPVIETKLLTLHSTQAPDQKGSSFE